MELTTKILQEMMLSAIHFGAKQERERAGWLESIGGAPWDANSFPELVQGGNPESGNIFSGSGHASVKLSGAKTVSAMPVPRKAKTAEARHPKSRKSGLSKAIKDMLSDPFNSYSLADIVSRTEGKEASVRMALHTMKSKGTASYDSDTKMWTGINSEGFPHGNGSEQVAA